MRRRFESLVHLAAPAEAVFARLDDQTRLAEHMERPSAMMGGGRMTCDFDEGRGRAVGSRIRMGGSAFGLALTERDPPRRKVWETVGPTRLLVVVAYEMGFEIRPEAIGSSLHVWIRYDLASTWVGRWLGPFLAPLYARWCVGRMTGDAARHFSHPPGRREPVTAVRSRTTSR